MFEHLCFSQLNTASWGARTAGPCLIHLGPTVLAHSLPQGQPWHSGFELNKCLQHTGRISFFPGVGTGLTGERTTCIETHDILGLQITRGDYTLRRQLGSLQDPKMTWARDTWCDSWHFHRSLVPKQSLSGSSEYNRQLLQCQMCHFRPVWLGLWLSWLTPHAHTRVHTLTPAFDSVYSLPPEPSATRQGRQEGQSPRRGCDDGNRDQRFRERAEAPMLGTLNMEETARSQERQGGPGTAQHSLCHFLPVTSALSLSEGSSPGHPCAGLPWTF